MAKAEPLTLDALRTPQITPKAATPARSPAVAPKPDPSPEPTEPKAVDQVPLQLKIPRDEARAIKIAAAERDMTIRDFMLACFHAFMKDNK
jgi:NRPS condensation-like uncharacterized protein